MVLARRVFGDLPRFLSSRVEHTAPAEGGNEVVTKLSSRPLVLPRQHTPPDPLPRLFLEKGLSIEGKHFPAVRNLLAPLKFLALKRMDIRV